MFHYENSIVEMMNLYIFNFHNNQATIINFEGVSNIVIQLCRIFDLESSKFFFIL